MRRLGGGGLTMTASVFLSSNYSSMGTIRITLFHLLELQDSNQYPTMCFLFSLLELQDSNHDPAVSFLISTRATVQDSNQESTVSSLFSLLELENSN
jgi:hypothetical protein